jgi:hypothetical protein
MRTLRSRPLSTPVKLLAAALLLGAGAMGLTRSSAHADVGTLPAAPSMAGRMSSFTTNQYAMFTCASDRCTAQNYGDNYSDHTYLIANEPHTAMPSCKIQGVGPTNYLATVDGWTGQWRISAKDIATGFDDSGIRPC